MTSTKDGTETVKDTSESDSDSCDCKVGRVIEEYELDGVNRELSIRRRGESRDVASLRDLTEYFNKAVLQSAIERTGRDPLEGEVDNIYRLLTDDEISSGSRVHTRRRLERDGIDLEAVEKSFVSHPTIGNHLRNCLDVQRPTETRDRVATAEERIYKMQNRSEAVIRTTVEQLVNAQEIAAGDLSVMVDASVTCEACGVHAPVQEFIDRGGCDCETE